MNSYQQLKLSHETSSETLRKIHKRLYVLSFGILGVSFLVSQAFLYIFKNPSLFFSSSFWMLIAGLPVLGFQLKKGRKIDQKITETLLQGLNLEMGEKSGSYVNVGNEPLQFERLICS